LIKVENLIKRYGATTAVDDISFDVKKNEVLGFLGPNGAGKSTTLKVLTCFHSATSGSAIVDGKDVFLQPQQVKEVIGYLPENVPLYPELRVREYLGYRAGLKKVPRSKRKKAIDNVIERCRLDDVQNRIIGQLSKGYRQRVGIADALVADPKILILDEPTIGLDPNQIRQVRELIKDLGKERTIILSSHILQEVEAVCSRVLIINKGKIVEQGRPDELRASMSNSGATIAVEAKDPSGVAKDILGNVDGVRTICDGVPLEDELIGFTLTADQGIDVRERIFDAAVNAGFKLLKLSSKVVSLEDVFVEITTREDLEVTDQPSTDEVKETEGAQ